MTGALILLGVLVLVGLVLWLTHKPDDAPAPAPAANDDECCGLHEVCERDSLIASSPEAEYFEDEELDRYAGTAPEGYTPEQEEEFRAVLLTLRDDELAPWSRSLTVRGIALPTAVRDELLMMITDLRTAHSHA